MYIERGHSIYRMLILFIVLWAALSVVGGTLSKAGADLGAGSGKDGSAIEMTLKMCAVIFTSIAAIASGVRHGLWKRLPAVHSGFNQRLPVKFKSRRRPPPHGLSLLRRLQIIIV